MSVLPRSARPVAGTDQSDPAADLLHGPAADPSVRPQDDLFRAVNGTWLRDAEIPADRPVDGAFYRLRDESEAACRVIVERAAQECAGVPVPGSGIGGPAVALPATQLIGQLYRSFMDTERLEALGLRPLREQAEVIASIDDIPSLVTEMGALRRRGVPGAFWLEVDTDPARPEGYLANFWQGGLGLPDESYYREERYASVRESYREHLATMLGLAGLPDPAAAAARVFDLETEIAAAHWDRVRSRDQDQTYNRRDRAAVDALLSRELVTAWAIGAGVSPRVLDEVVVRQVSYFEQLGRMLTEDRLEAWRDWLIWKAVHAMAPLGPEELVQANFDFYGRILSGTPQLRERWKRGVGLVEQSVGEALGELYVAEHFPPNAKERMDVLVGHLLQAYRRSITGLPWMSEETKVRALDKLGAFTPKVGYPARWRDYTGLFFDPDDLLGNAARAAAFEWDRDLAKIGAPVDRDEWFMTPQTVNAYYNPGMNEIVFPAAILRPPFFDVGGADAANYGAIGAVIGHEIGHGFDDQGAKYDGRGALHDWWTAADKEAFQALTGRLIEQYSALEPAQLPGQHLNGALTVGENIGDLGGLGIALQALTLAGSDGTPDARAFFAAWARVWQSKIRDEQLQQYLAIDPHSPAEFRCNQVVRNLDEFHRAFDVQPGDGMWLDPQERVRIW
jgi:putative endopeptidase